MKRIISMLLAASFAVFAMSGCSQKSPTEPETGVDQGKLFFNLEASDNIATGQVTVAKGALSHVLPVTIADNTGTVAFDGIQVGHWNIQVQLFDGAGVEIYSGDGVAIVTKDTTTTVTIRVEHNTGNLEIIVEVPGLVLWNKLGSTDEVTNSMVGPNLTFSGDVSDQIIFESVQHDNGFRTESRWQGVEVPPEMLNPVQGCYEMWFKSQVTRPVAYQYGRLQWLDQSADGAGGTMQLVWDDGTPYGGVVNQLDVKIGDTIFFTPSQLTFTAEIGRHYHIALVWDVNGIDGTNDTVRVYMDGTLLGASTESYDPIAGNGIGNIGRIQNKTPGWEDCFGKLTFDNLKIWNYAKTDFSDRFYVDGSSPTTTPTITMTSSITPTMTATVPLLETGGYATPNPFLPKLGQKAFFNFQLNDPNQNYSIRIMSRNGRVVRILRNVNEWDGRNDSGNLCEGGLYIYQIEVGKQRVSGEVVLIK
jgi:concanavalin A-like lectin/glucanase superfamily protein